MECPILMAVEGEAAGIVEQTGSGICIPSGCPESLSEAVLDMANDRRCLAAFGRRGRKAVAASYNRSVKAHEVLSTLLFAVEARAVINRAAA